MGVCRLESGAAEASLVCREELIPANCPSEKGFRLFRVEGPLDFSHTAILSSLLNPLVVTGIAVFTGSTDDTDYLMIKEGKLKMAISTLGAVAKITI